MKRELKIEKSVDYADFTITVRLDNHGVPSVRIESNKGNMVIRGDNTNQFFDLCSFQLSNNPKYDNANESVALGDILTFDDYIVSALLDDWKNPILRVQAEKGQIVVRHDGSVKIFDLYSYQ